MSEICACRPNFWVLDANSFGWVGGWGWGGASGSSGSCNFNGPVISRLAPPTLWNKCQVLHTVRNGFQSHMNIVMHSETVLQWLKPLREPKSPWRDPLLLSFSDVFFERRVSPPLRLHILDVFVLGCTCVMSCSCSAWVHLQSTVLSETIENLLASIIDPWLHILSLLVKQYCVGVISVGNRNLRKYTYYVCMYVYLAAPYYSTNR